MTACCPARLSVANLLVSSPTAEYFAGRSPNYPARPADSEACVVQCTEKHLEDNTLVGGCKRLVAPDGSEILPTSKPQPDGTLVKALARAWRWQRMLDEGVYTTVRDIGDAENISKSYVGRILRLALLAPDIVDAILAGRIRA